MRDRPVDEGVEISAPTDLKLMREWTAGAAVRRAARRVDKPTALVLLGLGALIAVAVATVSMMPSGGDPASQLTLPLPGSSTVLRRLVHGSCSKQSLPHPFWATVQSHQPQLFVYNGDIVYGDCKNASCVELETAWSDLFSNPDFTAARSFLPMLGMLDDHDYGQDDCHASNPYKETAKNLFLKRFNAPASDPRRSRHGLYRDWSYGPIGQRVQLILLDTRYFRSPFKASGCPRCPGRERYEAYVGEEGEGMTMLGEEQWAWLEQLLRQPADLRLVFSTVQILADTHGYEAWSQIPLEVTRLRRLIGSTSANGVLLLSGDRHVAGFYTALPAVSLNPYPLHEVTASSLTHSSPFTSDVNEPARREQGEGGVAERTGDLMHLNNFGTIEIDWEERRVTVGLVVADECAIPDNHGCKELGAPAGRIFDSLSLHLDSDLTAPAPNQPPAPPPPPAAPKKLIIDTDLGFDADDAVALCLAHALADGGEIELLGVTHDAGYPMGVAAVAAINTWYGRGPGQPRAIELGAYKGPFGKISATCLAGWHGCTPSWPGRVSSPPHWLTGGFVDSLASDFPTGDAVHTDGDAVHTGIHSSADVPDALLTLRKLLSLPGAKDITLVALGVSTNFAALLISPGDDVSPLSGRELLASRVREVVWQGGWYEPDHPDGHITFNLNCGSPLFDPEGCANSSSIAVNGFQDPSLRIRNTFTALGDDVRTGGPLATCAPLSSPCRAALDRNEDPTHTRPSWDPIAVLAAARGADHPSLRASIAGGGAASNYVDGTGANFWSDKVTAWAEGVGEAGGACTCPGGGGYWAGVRGEGCGGGDTGGGAQLACEGGRAGACQPEPGPWSHNLVSCGNNTEGEGGEGGSVFLVQEGAGRTDLSARLAAEADLAAEIDRLLCLPPRFGAASRVGAGGGAGAGGGGDDGDE